MGAGSVFELTLKQNGVWVDKPLHFFRENRIDGYGPTGSLLLDKSNNIYGVTDEGGAHDTGTVFEITP